MHGIKRNPGDRSRAEFRRQTEHGGTGKAHRMRNIERLNKKGQVGLGCGLGGVGRIEIYTKKTAGKAIRVTSKGQNPNKIGERAKQGRIQT